MNTKKIILSMIPKITMVTFQNMDQMIRNTRKKMELTKMVIIMIPKIMKHIKISMVKVRKDIMMKMMKSTNSKRDMKGNMKKIKSTANMMEKLIKSIMDTKEDISFYILFFIIIFLD